MTMTTAGQYDWLAMLYLGGDDDLFEFGTQLLNEAKGVGSSNRVAIVAQHDPAQPKSMTRRGQLLPGQWASQVIGETHGSPKDIVDFIDYAKRSFPASKRMLVLWDHGNGWQNVHAFESVMAATVRLRIQDLSDVVHRQQGINVLCFDSCLMAMIEIAYQLRERVEYIVASENVVPADSGWPYDSILRTLTVRPQTEPEQVVRSIVDGFCGSYNGSGQPVTLSAIKVAAVEPAVAAIDAFARELIAACINGSREQVMFARRYSQSFGNPDYVDLFSFCDELQRLVPDKRCIFDAAEEVKKAIHRLVIGTTRGGARSIRGAHGISVYFPDRPISPLYYNLDFAQPKTCMWASFITMMAPKIAAPRRIEKPPSECICERDSGCEASEHVLAHA
jgi:hypothetical protein